MLHSAASDVGLHCLPITFSGVSRLKWVKTPTIFLKEKDRLSFHCMCSNSGLKHNNFNIQKPPSSKIGLVSTLSIHDDPLFNLIRTFGIHQNNS